MRAAVKRMAACGVVLGGVVLAAAPGTAEPVEIDVPVDKVAKYYLIETRDLADGWLWVHTNRVSPSFNSHAISAIHCADRKFAYLGGGLDAAEVLKEAEATLANGMDIHPMVNTGADKQNYQLWTHPCRAARGVDLTKI